MNDEHFWIIICISIFFEQLLMDAYHEYPSHDYGYCDHYDHHRHLPLPFHQ